MAETKEALVRDETSPSEKKNGELFPELSESQVGRTESEMPGMPIACDSEAGEGPAATETEDRALPQEVEGPTPPEEGQVLEIPRNEPAARGFDEPLLDENAVTVLARRYLKKDDEGSAVEEPRAMFIRVARNIAEVDRAYDPDADVDALTHTFYDLMASLDFLPNSPTLMNAGRELQQLSACFVLPVEDSLASIFEAVKNTALIHQSGGGTGFSFSRLRPKNDIVSKTKGVSSGPVSFMRVFNAATEAIKQGGTRRGANMGILRIDHPDIEEFIHAKENHANLTNFNISVALTEEFMEAVRENRDYDLRNPRTGKSAGKRNAKKIFDEIIEMAHKNGEPGIIFIDRLNSDNPTPNVGAIEATNPCGEQPLLPYESCNLGSINLAHMIIDGGGTEGGSIDFEKLGRTVDDAVHFLDNVIDANRYPLDEIRDNTKANRKIGLGVMGFAEMLIQMSIPYDSEEGLAAAEDVMSFIQARSKEVSTRLALSRGSFPSFAGSRWEKEGMRMLRNATTTTIAPTGTISIIAGASSGIEPLFALSFIRHVMDDDELLEVNKLFAERAKRDGFESPDLMKKVAQRGGLSDIDEVPDHVRRVFVTAHDIAPDWHIRMQAVFQKYTDNAVSKTVNFPEHATEDDIRRVYELAYELGCKGVTVYRDKSREAQVLNIGEVNRQDAGMAGPDAAAAELPQYSPYRTPRPRAEVTRGSTRKMKTGCGDLYVTINEDEHGLFEVFAQMGKAGGCSASQNETAGRLISLGLRSGIDVNSIIKQLTGIRCPSPFWYGGAQILSCSDAIAKALRLYIEESPRADMKDLLKPEIPLFLVTTCPDCGSTMVHESGCVTCTACGFSKC